MPYKLADLLRKLTSSLYKSGHFGIAKVVSVKQIALREQTGFQPFKGVNNQFSKFLCQCRVSNGALFI